MPTPLSAILTQDRPLKRPTQTGNYLRSKLPWSERQKWVRLVQRAIIEAYERGERVPHKVLAVASAIGNLGDECYASRPTIAKKAGCATNTVGAVSQWLEARGLLTWSHTARRHPNGHWVRSSNLYTLIMRASSFIAALAQARRPVWRDRTPGKTNCCPGLNQQRFFIDPEGAERARLSLAEVGKAREVELEREWKRQRVPQTA